MLDALVDREDGDVARAGQPAVVEERLEVAEHLGGSVRHPVDVGDRVGPRRGELVGGNSAALMAEQVVGVSAEQGCNVHLGGSCLVILRGRILPGD